MRSKRSTTIRHKICEAKPAMCYARNARTHQFRAASPSTPTTGPRRVVAWAHGTVGLVRQCAPSRADDPLSHLTWLTDMISRGWVVVATDYAGLGTRGPQQYLVAKAEAYDVVNSVRAAMNLPETGAGALATANAVKAYAPELNLVGTVAAAPAADLSELMSTQYAVPATWILGPPIMLSCLEGAGYEGCGIERLRSRAPSRPRWISRC